MLYRGVVAPGNVLARKPKDSGNSVPLGRAGRPLAVKDGPHPPLVQAGFLGQLPGIQPMLDSQFLNRSQCGHWRFSLAARWRPLRRLYHAGVAGNPNTV
jgi:hypothetical protein